VESGILVRTIVLNDLQALVLGLAVLLLAQRFVRKLPFIGRLNVPTPVLAGAFIAVIVAVIRSRFSIEITFAKKATDFLLLVFFTTVGLSAKLAALRAGQKPLAIICGVTVLLIVVQNLIGVAVAMGVGAHPMYGLLIGSCSFVGGPGTAAAWAKEAEAQGLAAAAEVGIAGATSAVVIGALVAGPIAAGLIRWKKLSAGSPAEVAAWAPPRPVEAEAEPKHPEVERIMSTFLVILFAVLLGASANEWARGAGFVLPGFLTAMLAGVLITNIADLVRWKLDFEPIERDGEFALQAFLVMYLMGLKLWTLGAIIGPLTVNVIVQVIVATVIAVFVLFRALGRDYDAAVTVGGFLGYGLSSMPAGMAAMGKVTSRYGASPRAFLLVTLAGSFFVDLANAFIVQGMLALPFMHK
jgi:ESS family glutamate:Na+ symporter